MRSTTASSFTIAAFFVSPLIQGAASMSWRIAPLMSWTICSMSALACGPNASSTNALPSASPTRAPAAVLALGAVFVLDLLQHVGLGLRPERLLDERLAERLAEAGVGVGDAAA